MLQPLGDQHQNLIYLYDLPKADISSKKIAEAFKNQAQVHLDIQPQLRRDITRPFYTAIVNIKDSTQFEQACEKMRYFTIDGKQCRALQFDKQLLGNNKEKLISHNVFVKSIPKEMTHKDLQTKFETVGKIKSLKISLNPDHTSRGYGFICFNEEDAATKAVNMSKDDPEVNAMKFEPKDRRSFKKLKNNIYVKNIPLEMADSEVRGLFEAFGNIKSLILQKNDIGQFGFVCYDDPANADKEYGPQCAQKAIDELSGRDMGNQLKLYVRHAMNKTERDIEKKKDTIRYKASKKRCNLYVKNFPSQWTETDIKNLFEQFGQIEKIRLEKGKAGNAFAFVCFKTPDSAAAAKQTLHSQTYDGKALMINHYEIKEIRQIQKEEAIDKSDFEKYQAQQTGGFHLNDLTSHPFLAQILQQLIEIMHQNEAMNAHFNQSERNMNRGPKQHQRNYNPRGPHQQNQGGNMHQMQQMQQQQMGQKMPGMPGQQQMPQMPQMPQPGMPQMPMQQPGMPQMPGVPGQQAPRQQMTPAQKFQNVASRLLPSVTERNPYLSEQIGNAIFEFVNLLVSPEKAPKITGMLIELPIDQIKQYMGSFEALQAKVKEANDLIDNAEKQGMNA